MSVDIKTQGAALYRRENPDRWRHATVRAIETRAHRDVAYLDDLFCRAFDPNARDRRLAKKRMRLRKRSKVSR